MNLVIAIDDFATDAVASNGCVIGGAAGNGSVIGGVAGNGSVIGGVARNGGGSVVLFVDGCFCYL